MASIFGHALIPTSLSPAFSKSLGGLKGILLGIFCSIIPDADVIGFKFHVAYGSFWGHRGFSHSLFFALLLSISFIVVFYRSASYKSKFWLLAFFFISTASHGVLDGMTTGGMGIAYFSPFDNTRYFLPWRPIMVSPIGAGAFFSTRGLMILINEFIWIGIPSFFIYLVTRIKVRGD